MKPCSYRNLNNKKVVYRREREDSWICKKLCTQKYPNTKKNYRKKVEIRIYIEGLGWVRLGLNKKKEKRSFFPRKLLIKSTMHIIESVSLLLLMMLDVLYYYELYMEIELKILWEKRFFHLFILHFCIYFLYHRIK